MERKVKKITCRFCGKDITKGFRTSVELPTRFVTPHRRLFHETTYTPVTKKAFRYVSEGEPIERAIKHIDMKHYLTMGNEGLQYLDIEYDDNQQTCDLCHRAIPEEYEQYTSKKVSAKTKQIINVCGDCIICPDFTGEFEDIEESSTTE